MEEAYAQALWDLVEGGMPARDAVKAMHGVLSRSGRLALLPRVANAFKRIAARKREGSGITLSVAREKDARAAMREAGDILASLGAGSAEAEVVVDDSLIGGWRLEGRETLVDASFKRQLLELYGTVTGTLARRSDASEVGI